MAAVLLEAGKLQRDQIRHVAVHKSKWPAAGRLQGTGLYSFSGTRRRQVPSRWHAPLKLFHFQIENPAAASGWPFRAASTERPKNVTPTGRLEPWPFAAA
jgi:hypothetical protein